MTSPTMEGALAEIASARRDRDAEMFRAGAEAMRNAALDRIAPVEECPDDRESAMEWNAQFDCAARIRSIPIPEMKP